MELKAWKRRAHREQEADARLLTAEWKLRHEQKLDADQATRPSSRGTKAKQRRQEEKRRQEVTIQEAQALAREEKIEKHREARKKR